MTPDEDHRQDSDAEDTSAPKTDTKDSDGAKTAAEVHAEAAHRAAAEKAGDTADHHQDSEAAEASAPVDTDKAAHLEQMLHDLPAALERFREAADYIHELVPRIVALEDFVHRLTSATSADFSFPQLVDEFKALKLKLRHMI